MSRFTAVPRRVDVTGPTLHQWDYSHGWPTYVMDTRSAALAVPTANLLFGSKA